MAADEHHLFLTVHHAVCDGWSSGTVLRNLVEAYTAERHGTAVDESPAMQLSEYVDWFDRYLSSAERGEDERFWAARVTPDFPTTELPADNPRAARKTYGAQPAGAAPRPRAGRRPSRARGRAGNDAVRAAAGLVRVPARATDATVGSRAGSHHRRPHAVPWT